MAGFVEDSWEVVDAEHKKNQKRPGAVVEAYNLSTLGGWYRKLAGSNLACVIQ